MAMFLVSAKAWETAAAEKAACVEAEASLCLQVTKAQVWV